jgi:PIN domain nuclease of toxin-antitoxin system
MSIAGTSSTPRAILLDTCAAIWLVGEEPFSKDGRDAIRVARASNSGVYVSPFSAWEIGMLVAKNRIQLTMPPDLWFERLLALPGVRLAALTPALLLSSTALPGILPNDPADRIIAATARTYGYFLITKDRPLLDYARQGHIQAIAC